jgi:DNA primase
VCAEAGAWGRAVFLPEGEDPDSYVRANGRDAMEKLLGSAPSLTDFYFDQVVPAGSPLAQRVRAAQQVRETLGRVRDDVHREMLVQRAAERLGMEVSQVLRSAPAPAARPQETTRSQASPAERLLIEAMALDREVAEWVDGEDGIALIEDAALADAGARIVSAWRSGEPIGEAVTSLPAALASRLSSVVVGGGLGGETNQKQVAADCLRRLRERAARRRRVVLEAELREGDVLADEAGRRKLEHLDQLLREERRRDD